jgi:hypothetical protein
MREDKGKFFIKNLRFFNLFGCNSVSVFSLVFVLHEFFLYFSFGP